MNTTTSNWSSLGNNLFSDNPYNLTQKCLDTFSTPSSLRFYYDSNTFSNCLMLSNITNAITNGSVPDDLAAQYAEYGIGVGTGSKDLWGDIVSQTLTFFHDACALSDCSDFNKNSTCKALNISATQLSLTAVNSCKVDICEGVKRAVQDDPDIGGIGVFISYALQIVMVLLIAFHVAHRYILRLASRRRPSHPIVPLASRAFNDACMNFHKTQCWFVATIVTAAFIRRATDNVSLVDTTLLLSITLSGMTLVSFTLLTLYYLERGMDGHGTRGSWYVYILSFVAFMLCAVFMGISLKSRALSAREWGNARSLCSDTIHEIPERQVVIDYVTTNSDIPRRLYAISLGFCTIVMLGLFIRQSEEIWDGVKETKVWRIGRYVVAAIVIIMYTALIGFIIFGLNLFVKLINTGMWGFGQIIALFIWVPIVLDYLHDRWQEGRPKNRKTVEEDMMELKQTPPLPPMSSPDLERDSRHASASESMLHGRVDGYSRLHARSQSDADDLAIHRARTDFV